MAREYASMAPSFWTGETGKALRGHPEAQVVATYLVTCPSANMVGLYYLPLPTLVHETGLTLEGASKGLRRVEEAGFAFYDPEQEHVWVPEMARFQIAEELKAADNRVKAIIKALEPYKKSKFYVDFAERYWRAFSLPGKAPTRRAFEAPSKGLRSQEQEQDQDQDQEEAFPAQAPAADQPTDQAEPPAQKPAVRVEAERLELELTGEQVTKPRKLSWQQELWRDMRDAREALLDPPDRDIPDAGIPDAKLNTLLKRYAEKHGREWLLPAWECWLANPDNAGLDPPFALQVFLTDEKVNRYVAQAKRDSTTREAT